MLADVEVDAIGGASIALFWFPEPDGSFAPPLSSGSVATSSSVLSSEVSSSSFSSSSFVGLYSSSESSSLLSTSTSPWESFIICGLLCSRLPVFLLAGVEGCGWYCLAMGDDWGPPVRGEELSFAWLPRLGTGG